MHQHQTMIMAVPEIIYQDKNKLELKVPSKTTSDKYYCVTIKRQPPSVTCNCISGKIRNYCNHIKQVKGYITAFIGKNIDMNMKWGRPVEHLKGSERRYEHQ